jgi:DhnA family fructose-bisphosphate aldolase class Ia
MDTVESSLNVVAEAVQAGAAGVVFGRNIWQAPNPAGMVCALKRIIHEGATVSDVMGELTGD